MKEALLMEIPILIILVIALRLSVLYIPIDGVKLTVCLLIITYGALKMLQGQIIGKHKVTK